MPNFFRDIPIRTKLFLSYVLFFLCFFSIIFSFLYFQFRDNLEQNIERELKNSNRIIRDMVETASNVSIKSHLRAIAEKNLEVVSRIHADYKNGLTTEEAAFESAVKVLLSQTIGQTGYIYCIDSHGIARVHPRAGVLGNDFSYRGFIQEQVTRKTGYLEYDWKNPGETSTRPKALYMSYFAPWDWIISASSYMEEFKSLIGVADFRDQILGLKFGKSGYSYVFDLEGNVIIHPELEGNLFNTLDGEGRAFVKRMIGMKEGSLFYSWQNPSESQPREKFVAFDYLPGYDWIVASSSYVDEVFSPLYRIRNIFIVTFGFSLLLAAIVSLLLSATITRPLTALIRHFERGADGNWSVRMNPGGKDEIGQLTNSFNIFMDKLSNSNTKLLEEIETRRNAENQLRLFEKVFENAEEGIAITDPQGAIVGVNPAFSKITEYSAAEVIGNNPRVLKSDRHEPSFYTGMWNSLLTGGHWSGEIWNRRKGGEAYPELLSINAIRNAEGETTNYVSVFHDITEMKSKERQIEYLAYHDPLTDLPNRSLLKDRLNQAIARAQRKKNRILILFVDIDNFKNVNDSLGHATGDRMLQQVAERFRKTVRTGDTVSRLGGDEFIIMVPEVIDDHEVIAVVERIHGCFSEPFHLGRQAFGVTVSIGLSVYPTDGDNPEDLIKNADMAMYQSKEMGKNMFHLFSPAMEAQVRKKVQLETDMRRGIDRDEFTVFFQPRIDAATRVPTGMEALVRWFTPDGKMVSPNDFIPLAEESGLIVPLGESIFTMACTKAMEIMGETGLDLNLSVNVSARQFEHDGFQEMVSRVLSDTAYPPEKLELEITESILMQSVSKTEERLLWLAGLGILLAIDDFGTGYSSLSYLKRMPVSVLKIDKSFVDDLPEEKDNATIVETICLMATKLNIGIVAEGVETAAQLEFLASLGDLEIQGYFFTPPLPADRLIAYLEDKRYKTP